MTEETIKCIVSRYDATITEPPFTIPIDTIEIKEPLKDPGGAIRYHRLRMACKNKGYVLSFYTMSEEEGITHEVIVK